MLLLIKKSYFDIIIDTKIKICPTKENDYGRVIRIT